MEQSTLKERPITFTDWSVKQIILGGKTQTRRVVKPQPFSNPHEIVGGSAWWFQGDATNCIACPYGKPGDHLWVREVWAHGFDQVLYRSNFDVSDGFGSGICRMSTGEVKPLVWRSPFHLRRADARLELEVVDINVERVQDITEDDAVAEGCEDDGTLTARGQYRKIWNEINAKKGMNWDVNPYVWAVKFKPLFTVIEE